MKYAIIILSLVLFVILGGIIFDFSQNDEYAANAKRRLLLSIKERFLHENGMVESGPGGTTSESQSYLMLIAVLDGDQNLFDKTWRWTKENLQTRDDELFTWVWRNGRVEDMHSASDADQDIALALILAYRLWDDPVYLGEAHKILRDFWANDTKVIGGRRYVTGGEWTLAEPDGATLNPSYFAPYAYRVFARYDLSRDWMSLVDSSYHALAMCSSGAKLPPNWCKINSKGDAVENFSFGSPDPDNFSYDALRVPFRIALDYAWFGEKRAIRYLSATKVFSRDWGTHRRIYAAYASDGTPQVEYESYASYGAQLAQFSVLQKVGASRILREKIIPANYSALDFYDLAWMWFGLHFYTDEFGKELIK